MTPAATMKAAAIDHFGPPSAITLHTLPVPEPDPHEVVIQVHAAGVGSWDESIRDGSWKPPGRTKFPLVLGTDGAGVVVATGSRAKRFRVGDRVYAYEALNKKGGFYAEYVAVDQRKTARVPQRLDLLQAGACAVTGLTALQGVEALDLRRGQTVLVFGASGAVGSLAVQFARARGARVIATASGRSAAGVVKRLGAHVVIDARRPDMPDRLRALATASSRSPSRASISASAPTTPWQVHANSPGSHERSIAHGFACDDDNRSNPDWTIAGGDPLSSSTPERRSKNPLA
jgi:NADPH:quinone reductase-like Zn-dependent oxidoreductase